MGIAGSRRIDHHYGREKHKQKGDTVLYMWHLRDHSYPPFQMLRILDEDSGTESGSNDCVADDDGGSGVSIDSSLAIETRRQRRSAREKKAGE